MSMSPCFDGEEDQSLVSGLEHAASAKKYRQNSDTL